MAKSNIKWRLAYDADENERIDKATMIDTGPVSLTLQAPAEEQDINVIMRRFGVRDGSKVPQWTDPNAMYGDYSEVPADPVEAAEYIRRGRVAFAALPAEVRRQFDSAEHMHNWLRDPKNAHEAIRLGILHKSAAPAATLDTVAGHLEKLVSSSTSSDERDNLNTPNNGGKK